MSADRVQESKPILEISHAASTSRDASRQGKQRGYALSVLVAFLSVSASVFTGQASASPVPHYTGNLVIAVAGALSLALVLGATGVPMRVDGASEAGECVSFGVYNAVFQLGFFKSMGHLDVTG